METNYLAILGAAFVPMIIGFLWYGPALFQNVWMKEADMTEEKVKSGNMALIFGVSFFFSLLIAFFMQFLVIHQFGMFQTLAGEPGFMESTGGAYAYFQEFMSNFGDRFRTFQHGALHGVIVGLFFILPILGIKALFERKSFKYILINVGYWTVTLALMGGIVCQWS